MNFSIDFNGSWLLLIALCLLAIGLAILVYRRTLPPLNRPWRIALGVLRSLTLLLLLFLIFEPSFKIQRRQTEKPLLAVLFDDTQSLKIRDASKPREQQLQELMQHPLWQELRSQYELRIFAAGDSLRDIGQIEFDSLSLNVIGTDLAKSLELIRQLPEAEELSACLLISDGGDNAGGDPAQAAGALQRPIFTVGVGDTMPVVDAWIAALDGAELAYRGKETQLTARLRAKGFSGRSARLVLRDAEGRKLSEQIITLPPDELESEATLTFTPQHSGKLPLHVILDSLSGERSAANNLRAFPLEVRESLIKIVLISALPSFEAMFFARTAAQINDLELISFTLNREGGVLQGSFEQLQRAVFQAQALVLMDFDRGNLVSGAQQRLLRICQEKPIPTWAFALKSAPSRELLRLLGDSSWRVGGALPPSNVAAFSTGFYVEFDPDAEAQESLLWRDLPPLSAPEFWIQPQETDRTLLRLQDAESGEDRGPALLVWESGGRRYAASFGSGYWRWSFLAAGTGGNDELYRGLLRRTLRWLAATPESKLLRFSADRSLYSSGETVKFSAQVQSREGSPVASAQVEVMVRGAEEEQRLILEPDGKGGFSGVFQPQGVGDYRYESFAIFAADTIGSDSGSFMVEAFNVEQETTQQNRRLLQAIADVGGGRYLPADSIAALPSLIQPQPRVKVSSFSRRFFLNWDLWAALFLLLGAEWFIRKRKGML